MIRNYNLQLLSGGFHHCTASWGKLADGWDHCFKFYFPVRGEACVAIDQNVHTIKPGRFYFVCGYRVDRQFCSNEMDVYWVHFIPTSLQLHRVLQRIEPLYAWDSADLQFMEAIYTRLDHLFQYRDRQVNELAADSPAELPCMTCSMLLYLIGDLLARTDAGAVMWNDPVYQRLRPSIEYMDAHFKVSPSLEVVAQRSHLAPNYFHSLFTATFDVTPFAYMLRRRMDTARQLLSNTTMTVREVAANAGYGNEFYFSRVFKKQFGVSPSRSRQRRQIG